MSALLPTESLAPDEYHVYALCFATAGERRRRDAFLLPVDPHDGPMPMDYSLWIVRNGARCLLVDTGFGPEAAARRGRVLAHDPVAALARIGLAADSVTDVVLSHLHYDHAGNIAAFPTARIHVQDDEVAHATGRCMCDDLLRFPFEVEDVVALIRKTYAKQTVFHDGDDDLAPGITLHKLPGHAAGLQAVRVKTPRGPVLLASDAVHFFPNLARATPFPFTLDMPATLASFRKVQALVAGPAFLIPGHDPKVRAAYPALVVNGVTLSLLHETPQADPAWFADLATYAEGTPIP